MSQQRIMRAIIDNISKVIIGKKSVAELCLISLLCEGHVLVEDVPGVGKTSLVSSLAKSIDCSFRRIQFTPDILPSDLTGFSIFNQKTGEFEYKTGLLMSSFILADEINRTSPKTQASLLEVMEENQVTVDGVTRKVTRPFMVMATQNPHEFVGTYPLPEAQMDRFIMRIRIGYPEQADEVDILKRFKHSKPIIEPVATPTEIVDLQEDVKNVFVNESVYGYIVDLVRSTRTNPNAELGASPRGSFMLYRAAQAFALYAGRAYVIPDDVKLMAKHVLAHRIVLSQDAKIHQVTQEDVVETALKSVTVPAPRVQGNA